jgi:hypothetical protein
MILRSTRLPKQSNYFKDINSFSRVVLPASLHNIYQASLLPATVLIPIVNKRPIPRRHFPLNDRIIFVFVKRPQPCELPTEMRNKWSLSDGSLERKLRDIVRHTLTRQYMLLENEYTSIFSSRSNASNSSGARYWATQSRFKLGANEG